MTEPNYTFIKRKELTNTISISQSKIKELMRTGQWIEGIHFTRYSKRMNLFNVQLIRDWLVNHHDPLSHQRAIENFLATLPSNRSRGNNNRAVSHKTASNQATKKTTQKKAAGSL
ncbi:hypothetical protein V0288_22765 [Pannus brasiliensis CCIBt3594]|uniref:Uncharacterized protein n=1 Tax=Pannus brasiliensis CCIBt3594 TaxID=1427578 RepID=A0AAW9R0H1_9CHRO